MTHATILVVDDDERLRHTLSLLLRTAGYEVVAASDVAGAEDVLRGREVDVVISDVRMPGGSGLDLLESVRRLEADTPVILLTAYGSVTSAVQAMQRGAFDYVLKPFDADELKLRVSRALALRRFRAENEFLREAPAATFRAPTSPPCSSTRRLTIARPSPTPSGFVVKKGENARSRASGVKPAPESSTSITAHGGAGYQRTATCPGFDAAWTALCMRFISTCCI